VETNLEFHAFRVENLKNNFNQVSPNQYYRSR
jgi:hypothetical protein